MTTTWKILDTKYQIEDGLIIKVVYRCVAQLDNFLDIKMGELELTGDPTSSDFVPFDNLTETTILGWVKTSLGEQQVTAIETELQNNVTARKAAQDAQTTKQGLPWIK
jgi:hypothetical protein